MPGLTAAAFRMVAPIYGVEVERTTDQIALFLFFSLAHVALILFGLSRMLHRPATARTPHVYSPRTSFLLGRSRDPKRPGDSRR